MAYWKTSCAGRDDLSRRQPPNQREEVDDLVIAAADLRVMGGHASAGYQCDLS
jgi:hypothetical protein